MTELHVERTGDGALVAVADGQPKGQLAFGEERLGPSDLAAQVFQRSLEVGRVEVRRAHARVGDEEPLALEGLTRLRAGEEFPCARPTRIAPP